MYRWTARFVVLAMLVPIVGPLALARVAPAEGMHCMRRPLADAAATTSAEPVMHCHQVSPQGAEKRSEQTAASAASSEALVHSVDSCCNHDCCRSAKTSEWTQPAGRHSSYLGLLIEPVLPALAARIASQIVGADSARAPPRS
jgi:hypothetical protein